jgi:hypothetical protein
MQPPGKNKMATAPTLAHYHARHPRYILQPQDNNLIRVSGPRQIPWDEATEIKNISVSGLAFTAPAELCPIVGEFIKIEFHVPGDGPGSGPMACQGLVVRLETRSPSTILVGIQFKKLELPQRLALAQALATKLKEQMLEHERKSQPSLWNRFRRLWSTKKGALLGAGFFLLAWCVIFYALSTILSST